MLGFYNYTVILTYMGVGFSMTAVYLSMLGHYKFAFMCMLLAALCDMLDGKVARTKKDRTETQKKFGIQIDSLCDVVCFSATPALVLLNMARNVGGAVQIPVLVVGILFTLCGVIRLAFFNVEEEERQNQTTERRLYYRGFPVTGASGIIPLAYAVWCVICKIASITVIGLPFVIIYCCILAVLGFFNIFDIKTPKPGHVGLVVLPLLGVFVFITMMVLG